MSLWLAACGEGDASPGTGTSNDSTSGSGPTTFSTFSTTAPMLTTASDPTMDSTTDVDTTNGSDSSDSSGSDSSSTSTGPGGMFCPDSHTCVSEAPEDWNGPVTLLRNPRSDDPDPEPASCERNYPRVDAQGFADLQAEPAECGCECGSANASACETSTTLRYWADDATCDADIPQTITVFAASCTPLPDFPGSANYTAEPLQAVGGACQAASDEVVVPAVWNTEVTACGGAELLEGCAEGRVCTPVPEAQDAALCIWREGEHECPDDFEVDRTLYQDIDDTRGCETCSCGAPMGICDDARVFLWNGSTCLVPAAGSISADAECHQGGSTEARAASLSAGQPTAFCSPSEPLPSGEAVGSEATTVCCLE